MGLCWFRIWRRDHKGGKEGRRKEIGGTQEHNCGQREEECRSGTWGTKDVESKKKPVHLGVSLRRSFLSEI
jgi:hypothetical protein